MEYTLSDLLDVPRMSSLLNAMSGVHGMPLAVIDMEGKVLTATPWQDICAKFHLTIPGAQHLCRKRNTYFENKPADSSDHFIYTCPLGLVDTAAPIIVEGKHLGDVYCGQVFLEPPDEVTFTTQARRYGFDEAAYLEAVRRVPVTTESQLHKNLALLSELADMFATEGLKKMRLMETEEALRISKEKFTKVFQLLPDAIDFVRTNDRVSVDFNEAFTDLFGYRTEDFMGKPVLPEGQDIWVNKEDRDRLMANLKEHGRVLGFEAPLRRKDGSTFVAEISCSVLEIDGEPYHLGITRDMTEWKRAICALQESEERYQRITEAITNYIYTVRVKDGCVTETIHGPGCIAVTGYHAEEFASDPFLWFRVVATDDRSRVEEQARRILAGEAPPPIEHRIVHKNGEVRWVRNTFVPYRDEHGALMGFDGLIQDITERKQGEERLREGEERYKKLFNEAPLGIALADSLTGHVFSMNPMFAKILGRTMEDPAQTNWMSITHPDDLQKDLDRMARLNAGEINGFQTEKRFLRPDGSVVYVSMTISQAKAEDKAHPRHLCMTEDITERKQAEGERRKLEERMGQLQKLEALGVLVAGVAHNINNVLAAIMATTSLSERLATETKDLEAYRNITMACRRGRDVVKSLTQFAQPVLSNPAAIDLHALINEVRVLLGNTTDNRISMVAELYGEPLWIYADAGSINHALVNLCFNSLDAMPNGGTLTFRTAAPERDWVEVSVEDTGGGMTPEVLTHALEPFFTTKEVGKGTGLGLSMTHGVIKVHGGTLEISSVLSEGTTVKLRFPRIPAPVQEQVVESCSPTPRALNVLLVDDDEDVRFLTAKMLEKAGHQIKTVAGGEEALESLSSGPLPDLIILDQNMPRMNGIQTMEKIRALHWDMPILISSGQPNIEEWECFKRPNVTVISKPFTMDELLAKMAKMSPIPPSE